MTEHDDEELGEEVVGLDGWLSRSSAGGAPLRHAKVTGTARGSYGYPSSNQNAYVTILGI